MVYTKYRGKLYISTIEWFIGVLITNRYVYCSLIYRNSQFIFEFNYCPIVLNSEAVLYKEFNSTITIIKTKTINNLNPFFFKEPQNSLTLF